MNKERMKNSQYKQELENIHNQLEAMRKDSEEPVDINLQEYVQDRWGMSLDTFYEDLGVNPSRDNINMLYTLPDSSYRYLIPEIIREPIRLGLRKSPIYPTMIAAEQTVSQTEITMPYINMSDATPRRVGEAETIPIGTVSFQSKKVKIWKMGRGFKIPYEVRDYVALDTVGIWMEDFGVKLGLGLDGLMFDVLINGDQSDGSESAPVIGVDNTSNGLVYLDILRTWIRLNRLGRQPRAMVGGETIALNTLMLAEFKDRQTGTPYKNLNLRTPIPQSSDYFIHGSIPADQTLIIDPSAALLKLNSKPLLLESDQIVSNQTFEFYASITTGFVNIWRDARVLVDQSLAFSSAGFPTWMDPTQSEVETIET